MDAGLHGGLAALLAAAGARGDARLGPLVPRLLRAALRLDPGTPLPPQPPPPLRRRPPPTPTPPWPLPSEGAAVQL